MEISSLGVHFVNRKSVHNKPVYGSYNNANFYCAPSIKKTYSPRHVQKQLQLTVCYLFGVLSHGQVLWTCTGRNKTQFGGLCHPLIITKYKRKPLVYSRAQRALQENKKIAFRLGQYK